MLKQCCNNVATVNNNVETILEQCWNNVLLFFKSIWEELNLEKSFKSVILSSDFEVFGLASPQLFGVTKTSVSDPISDAFLLQKSIRKVSEK